MWSRLISLYATASHFVIEINGIQLYDKVNNKIYFYSMRRTLSTDIIIMVYHILVLLLLLLLFSSFDGIIYIVVVIAAVAQWIHVSLNQRWYAYENQITIFVNAFAISLYSLHRNFTLVTDIFDLWRSSPVVLCHFCPPPFLPFSQNFKNNYTSKDHSITHSHCISIEILSKMQWSVSKIISAKDVGTLLQLIVTHTLS